MTPSERERRIEAAWHAYWEAGPSFTAAGDKHAMWAALDAADEAVPVVSEEEAKARAWAWVGECIEEAQQRAERAEAAAREYADALRQIERRFGSLGPARVAFARHPSFSGEEGTEDGEQR